MRHCNQKTILCDVEEATCTINSFVALPRLHATAVDCADRLISEASEIRGRLAKFTKINRRGVLNKDGKGRKKWSN